MNRKLRFLPFLLLLISAALTLVSCHRETVPSEDLFFQAMEQAASGRVQDAAATFSKCLERKDEWADVSSEQLLDLLSDYPHLEVSREILDIAHEYHPVQATTLKSKKDYPVTFSPDSLAGFSAQMLDEIGSSWLTSDIDRRKAADLMAEAALLKNDPLPSSGYQAEKWLLCFYAGRLYEKNGKSTYTDALSWYSTAQSAAYSELTYDRPLWYYLELSRRTSPRNTAALLPQLASTWHDPVYFDDFLDRLASDVLSNHDWKTFAQLFRENQSFFSSESRAKYAAITARLVECGLCSAENAGYGSSTEDAAASLYETVLSNAEYGSYYDLIARLRTGRPFTANAAQDNAFQEDEFLPADGTLSSGSAAAAPDAFSEHLAEKLIALDYPDYAFRFMRDNWAKLSNTTIVNTYDFLTTKAGARNRFLALTSLALKTARSRPDDTELVKLAYPLYYRSYIEAEARQWNVEPWLLFALIHSESCFQADITSAAGAHGLTQLMSATAGDVARKLKMAEYDLDDAETNVTFGAFYLGELIGRLDGDLLLAAFSYNAGITRVRNWRKQAPSLPPDVFLETIPYEETRLYGQKITRAAVMYGMLYYGEKYTDILERILKLHG